MNAYVALLRGINVGQSGKLAMRDLVKLCQDLGLKNVSTYIQSGNVVFTSKQAPATLKKKLERALAESLGKPVAVMIRTAAEMQAVLKHNPFPKVAGNKVLVLFLDEPPPRETFARLPAPDGEVVKLKGREVFVHYPVGQGKSKLKLPMVDVGTGRNMNTVTKLAEMVSQQA